MKRWAALLIGLLAAAAAAAAGTFGPRAAPEAPRVETITTPWVTTDQPEEDEPGWDCETMGNAVCGPQVDEAWVCERPVPQIRPNVWHLECGPRSTIEGGD